MVLRESLDRFDPFSPSPLGCVLDLRGRPFDGPTIKDNSPYGNHGTLTGATWVRLPSGLRVNSFDGDDVITIANSNSINLGDVTDSYSMITWFKTTVAGTEQTICYKTLSPQPMRLTVSATNILQVILYDGTNVTSADSIAIVSNNGWHLGVSVRNAVTDKVYCYVDANAAVEATDITVGSIKNTNPLLLGQKPAAAAPITGNIWGFRVINRALSATEINGIYQSERHLFGV